MTGAAAVSRRHQVEYRVVQVVLALARVAPRALSLAVGAAIGRLFFAFDGRRRRLAIDNLAAAFPQWSRPRCVATARQVFVQFGQLIIEVCRLHAATRDEIRARVEFDGEARAHEALRGGKGAIFVTGHFGFWELHAIAHGAFLYPVTVVARPLDNPLLHDLLERFRTATGNSVIYRKGGLRRMLRALGENQGLAVLIDQHTQPADALVVEFFGRPAATTRAVAALARRTGAPVIPVFTLPLEGGRYRLVYERAIVPPRDDSPEELRAFTQRCTDVLEMYVRRYPHLWLWMHRRWRDDES